MSGKVVCTDCVFFEFPNKCSGFSEELDSVTWAQECHFYSPVEEQKIKVYIAGPSNELHRAKEVMDWVRGSLQLELTHDWVTVITDSKQGGTDYGKEWRDDLDGVRRANYLWLLLPKQGSIGMWAEFGAFLERTRDPSLVVASGVVSSESMEVVLSPVKDIFPSDIDAFEFLVSKCG